MRISFTLASSVALVLLPMAAGCDAEPSSLPTFDGAPLELGPVGEWTFHPFADAVCRDGTATGLGIRPGSVDKLVLYFRGGGACFNDFTCEYSASHWDAESFSGWVGSIFADGIFDAGAPDNPVRDWTQVYIPYCTGDMHLGDRAGAVVDGVDGVHQFRGFANTAAFLDRLVPTFADVDEVLVVGTSAGGIGAVAHFPSIEAAFPEVRVSLLDDSGFLLPDAWAPACFQRQLRALWGLDGTLPKDCAACFAEDGGGLIELLFHVFERTDRRPMGIVLARHDVIMRMFLGYGRLRADGPSCPDGGGVVEEGYFAAGVDALAASLRARAPHVAQYVTESVDHTYVQWARYHTTEVAETLLSTWFAALLNGSAANVAP